MILGTFKLGSDIQEVIIRGNELMFTQDGIITTIEGIKLDKSGVLREFPDLKGKEDWRKLAIKRFKEHIKKMPNEMEAMTYVKNELIKQGYSPLFYQRAGHRPKKFQ